MHVCVFERSPKICRSKSVTSNDVFHFNFTSLHFHLGLGPRHLILISSSTHYSTQATPLPGMNINQLLRDPSSVQKIKLRSFSAGVTCRRSFDPPSSNEIAFPSLQQRTFPHEQVCRQTHSISNMSLRRTSQKKIKVVRHQWRSDWFQGHFHSCIPLLRPWS